MGNKQMSVGDFYQQNLGLIHNIAKKAYPRLVASGTAMDYEDLVGELGEVFIRSYELHDETKSKFSTYFTTAGFNHINSILKQVEEERYKYGVRSVEELGFDEEDNYLDSIECSTPGPEKSMEMQQEVEALIRRLSLEAQTILEWTIKPPIWMTLEYKKVIQFNKMLRLQGEQTRQAPEITMSFVSETLVKLGVLTSTEARRARKEISDYVRNVE